MKYACILTLVILSLELFAQGTPDPFAPPSQDWESALARLSEARTVEASCIGIAGSASRVYADAETVGKYAPEPVLISQLDHVNPVVRSYLLPYAVERYPYRDYFPYFLKELQARSTVQTQVGCIVSADYMADIYFDSLQDKLTAKQRDYLIEWSLQHENPCQLTGKILSNWEIPENYHSQIRDLAKDDGRYLIKVATWRKEADIPLIKSWYGKDVGVFFGAVREYPHSEFLEPLEDYSQHPRQQPKQNRYLFEAMMLGPTRTGDFYEAVLQYPPQTALPLLRNLLDADESTANEMAWALGMLDAPAYREMEFQLWEEYGAISQGRLELFIALDRERALRGANHLLPNIHESSPSGDPEASLEGKVLRLVVAAKPEGFLENLTFFVRESNPHNSELLINLQPVMNDAWVPILVEKIKENDNAHIYLHCAELLLSHPDRDMLPVLQSLINEHEHLRTDWGGERLQKIISEHLANRSAP